MARQKNIDWEALERMAFRIRDLSTRMIVLGGWGHIGGSYSLGEILSVLYSGFAQVKPDEPDWADRDYIVLSKGHSSPALYSALAAAGFFEEDKLYSYCTPDGFEGHLDQQRTPGLEMSGGTLGIGLSYSAGIALALKKQQRYHQRVYCIVGDGELCEGEIWEGVMFAAQNRLDNLIVVVDYNKVMAKGFVYEEIGQEPLNKRFESFGWAVLEVDGHDVEALWSKFYQAKYICVTGKPVCILAHTVKGRGVKECEFNYRWHTHAPSLEKGNTFLKELAETSGYEYVPLTCAPHKKTSLMHVVEGV